VVAFFGIVYVTLPHKLVAIFVKAEDYETLLPHARPLFVIVVICLVFDLFFNIYAGALRGAGDTRFTMLINIGSVWLIFVPSTIFAVNRFGLIGIWSCLIVHVAVMALVLHFRFAGRAWMAKGMITAERSDSELGGVDGKTAHDSEDQAVDFGVETRLALVAESVERPAGLHHDQR
jgi:Na+-driven multidrug efflux pump